MKKLITLVSLLFCGAGLFAQTSMLDDVVYLRGGFSFPIGGFGDAVEVNGAEIEEGNGETPFDYKVGSNIEIGSIFYIDQILDHDQMNIGIDVTYLSLQYNKGLDKTEGNYYYREDAYYHITPSLKLGVAYSYSPVDKLAFDAFVKANFSYAILYQGYDVKTSLTTTELAEINPVTLERDRDNINYDTEKGYGGFNIRPSFGVYARYTVLTLGVEFMTGSLYYKDLDSDIAEPDEYKFKNTSMVLNLGFAF